MRATEEGLWPDGQFVTTHLIVRTAFLEGFPGTVEAILRAHVQAVQYAEENPEVAKTAVNRGIEQVTGEPLPQEVLDRSWDNLTITNDPIAASLQKSAEDALTAGTAEEEVDDLNGIYDLSLLNAILEAEDLEPVSASATSSCPERCPDKSPA